LGSQSLVLTFVLNLLLTVVSTGLPAFCGWAFFSKTWKNELRGLFRPCGWRSFAVAVAVPVLILAFSRLVQLTVSEAPWRIDWRSDQAGPWFAVLATSLGYLPLALLEELGWRGYLQPRLIRLFGISRGIFLVGLLWGVYHLPGDLSSGSSLGWASYAVLVRLVGAVAYTVPLAWLLLRTRSILPGSVMHGTINYLHFAVAPLLPAWQWGGDWLGISLWAAVGYLMFKRWPPNVRASTLDSSQALTGIVLITTARRAPVADGSVAGQPCQVW
jgi:membrane protease YdiL (CAAX protease family)